MLTALSTLARPLPLANRAKYLLRIRRLKWALVEAQVALGERMYAAGIDDGKLGAKIAAVDELARRLSAGRSIQALRAVHRQLVLQLAVAALEDDGPLPGADAEYRLAKAAQAALRQHETGDSKDAPRGRERDE